MGRRSETSEYLKECIADAAIKLMRRQSLEKITVQDITKAAGVGRMTYFRYFSSKSDMLVYKLMLLWEAWGKKTPFPHNGGEREQALWFFSFCESILPLLKLVYRNEAYKVVLDAYIAYTEPLRTQASTNGKEARFLHMFFAYGMLGIITEWANGGFKESAEELTELCSQQAQS